MIKGWVLLRIIDKYNKKIVIDVYLDKIQRKVLDYKLVSCDCNSKLVKLKLPQLINTYLDAMLHDVYLIKESTMTLKELLTSL